jgi:hypothetical protein
MMEAPDLRDRHNGVAVGERCDQTRNRRVFVERQVRAGPFVVRTVKGHQSKQARFVEHDHMVETFATDRSDESLDERILPRCTRGREHLLDPHRLRRRLQVLEGVIAVVD